MDSPKVLFYRNEDADDDSLMLMQQSYDVSLYSTVALAHEKVAIELSESLTAFNTTNDSLQKEFHKYSLLWRSLKFEKEYIDLKITDFSGLAGSVRSTTPQNETEQIFRRFSSVSQGVTGEVNGIVCSLPHVINLGSISSIIEPSTIEDSSFKQLKKDIERDKLLINGNLYIGANGGIDGAIDFFQTTIEKLIYELAALRPDKSVIRSFGLSCLKLASRTNSGGIAFHMIQTVLIKDKYSLVPVSSLATPLLIRLSGIPIESGDGTTSISIRCDVECSTYFQIFSVDNDPAVTKDFHKDRPIAVTYMASLILKGNSSNFGETLNVSPDYAFVVIDRNEEI